MVNYSFKKSYNFNNFNSVKYDHLWGSKGVFTTVRVVGSNPRYIFLKDHLSQLNKSLKKQNIKFCLTAILRRWLKFFMFSWWGINSNNFFSVRVNFMFSFFKLLFNWDKWSFKKIYLGLFPTTLTVVKIPFDPHKWSYLRLLKLLKLYDFLNEKFTINS